MTTLPGSEQISTALFGDSGNPYYAKRVKNANIITSVIGLGGLALLATGKHTALTLTATAAAIGLTQYYYRSDEGATAINSAARIAMNPIKTLRG